MAGTRTPDRLEPVGSPQRPGAPGSVSRSATTSVSPGANIVMWSVSSRDVTPGLRGRRDTAVPRGRHGRTPSPPQRRGHLCMTRSSRRANAGWAAGWRAGVASLGVPFPPPAIVLQAVSVSSSRSVLSLSPPSACPPGRALAPSGGCRCAAAAADGRERGAAAPAQSARAAPLAPPYGHNAPIVHGEPHRVDIPHHGGRRTPPLVRGGPLVMGNIQPFLL